MSPDEERIHPQVRVVVRPYANPMPLGFFAFGIGMFLYAALSAPWVKPAETHTIGLLLAAFVAPIELIATVIAFLARDTASAAALGLFTMSWLSAGLIDLSARPGVLSAGDAFFLIAFSIVVVLLALPAFASKPFIGTLLLVSTARAVLYAVYELGGGPGWDHTSGWLALAIFCIAMYGGLAFLLEDLQGRTVLPIGRRGPAREAIEGGLGTQLTTLADEAGVRRPL
ncbi:MAG TPA: GPR1/FUN34/YaaH family transporter [Gaiellaceae bacterium]|nr:GPR1/FUN34/YaaH family transporter [Gaiellaceae bacterium]